jgi:nucleoside-diphosphate-sugar epimerase
MNPSPVVLVTGAAGRIGRAAVAELLARGVAVRGLDRHPCPGLGDAIVGDITHRDTVRRAMADVHTMVHLAATPDDVPNPQEDLLPANIGGVYEVLEAAHDAGVRRMILASSGQVVWGQRITGPWPIGVDVQPTPRYWYAATKMFLEAAGRAFADRFGMQVLVVRLGWCPRTREQEEEIAASEWAQDVYLSPGDAGRFFACAVESKASYLFEVVYATSRPLRPGKYDLKRVKKLTGYEPRDQWPEGL